MQKNVRAQTCELDYKSYAIVRGLGAEARQVNRPVFF
jgi:hypothetical protein